MSYVTLDTLYFIVLPKNQGVVYGAPAKTAGEAWYNVIDNEIMGTGMTKEILFKQGFRARKCEIALPIEVEP